MSSTIASGVSELTLTTKARELQRGLLAAAAGDAGSAARHFLAAAHLELVLAEDYESSGQVGAAIRSWISAASCFHRAGEFDQCRAVLDELETRHPAAINEIQAVRHDLQGS